MPPDTFAADALDPTQGEFVRRNYKPGYVVLSYLVSYIGAFTTLEILMRRTASRGWYNWFLLGAGAISMGGIAIWSMHFVGLFAVVLLHGHTKDQIMISPGYTALSLFISISVLFLAFGVAGSNRSSITRVLMGGTLAGFGICGMHFLGQAAIANYDCIYNIGNAVGAAIIAVVASSAALVIFFIFRRSWNSTWWKRGASAFILATAVSGMHWVSSVGTNYRIRPTYSAPTSLASRSTNVIVAMVLSISCCFILIGFTLLGQTRMIRAAKRAEQVVLAAAIFDSEGRLLVTHEGFLPRKRIVNSWLERSFDDVFSVAHPVFLWIFRASYNWSAVAHFIPGMRNHVNRTGLKGRLGSLDESVLLNQEGVAINDYSLVFRELYCIAAAGLASDLNQPMEKLGILYDEIVTTGIAAKATERGKRSLGTTTSSLLDMERDGHDGLTLGKGQLLFLVSTANRHEAAGFQAVGYRFAPRKSVVPIIANSLRLGPRALGRHLEIMHHYATNHRALEPGIHLAFFAIRASLAVGKRGFDVLVRKDARNQLPTMQAPMASLDSKDFDFLNSLDSKSVAVCVKEIYKASKPSNPSHKLQQTAKELLRTIEALKEEIGDPVFSDALLISEPFKIPCQGVDDQAPPGVALLIAFRLILPLQGRAPGRKLAFTPLSMFKAEQNVHKNSPAHAVFSRKVHREFAPLLDQMYAESVATKSSVRNSNATGSSRHDVGIGERVDMYGNLLPGTSAAPYRGPSKIRFWDNPTSPRSSRGRSNNASEQHIVIQDDRELTPKNIDHLAIRDGEKYSECSALRRPCSLAATTYTPIEEERNSFELLDPCRRQGKQKAPIIKVIADSEPEVEAPSYVDELFAVTIRKRQM